MKHNRVTSVHLHELRFGHQANPPINARRTGRDEGVAELASSIEAHGLIQALTVREIAGTAYVADGNRRLAALRLLAERGVIAENETIRCDIDVSSADPEEISAAANIMRVPLHEADQYETFRELSERGLSEAQIAARFGIEPARVKRMLAIGRLSPKVLDAWRNDELGNQPAGVVRAMTLAPSIEKQEEVFERLKDSNQLYPHNVSRAFGAGDREASKNLNFVGADAYAKAGGTVTVDLFGEDHVVSDHALAKKLADGKLKKEMDRLRAIGWKWAELYDELPYSWTYSWEKLPGKKKTASAEDKARSGCVLRLLDSGQLEITYGVIRPETARKAASSDSEKGEPKPATISAALMERLSVQATMAVRAALSKSEDVGLVALLAGFLSGGYYGLPIRVRHEGLGHHAAMEKESFEAAFERLCAMPDDELLLIAAGIAGSAVDLSRHNPAAEIFDDVTSVMVRAIDGDDVRVALRDAFDAEDYFKAAPKALILEAVGEAIGREYVEKAGKLKKADLAAYALKHIPQTGWLPKELRTVHYDGPGVALQEAAE